MFFNSKNDFQFGKSIKVLIIKRMNRITDRFMNNNLFRIIVDKALMKS
jgi:hypothetical protein